MTIGIYALSFEGTDKVYIGQSINIESRYSAHVRSLNRTTLKTCTNTKLYEAYTIYGAPSLTILELCREDELNVFEVLWIKEFDSTTLGLNITIGGSNGGSGTNSVSSRYSKDQIVSVFKYLLDSKLSYVDIEIITGVNKNTVADISTQRTHLWLKEEFREEYLLILQANILRATLSKRSKLKEYPTLLDTNTGVIYTNINNVEKLCREHGLNSGCLNRVLHGKSKIHKGWVVYNGS